MLVCSMVLGRCGIQSGLLLSVPLSLFPLSFLRRFCPPNSFIDPPFLVAKNPPSSQPFLPIKTSSAAYTPPLIARFKKMENLNPDLSAHCKSPGSLSPKVVFCCTTKTPPYSSLLRSECYYSLIVPSSPSLFLDPRLRNSRNISSQDPFFFNTVAYKISHRGSSL